MNENSEIRNISIASSDLESSFDVKEKFDGMSAFIYDIFVKIECSRYKRYGEALIDVIKLFALHPDADMSALLKKRVKCGEDINTDYAQVVKRSLDVNDIALYDNIEKLTGSKVYSAVEAVYNIANFVRLEYCMKIDGKGGIGGNLGA